MAIEFNSLISDINNHIYSIPIVYKIFSNVIYVSIILSIILIIILMTFYPCDSSGVELFKVFIYIALVNVLMFSAYNSIISNKYKKQYDTDKNHDFINSVNDRVGGAIFASDNIKVTPKFKDCDSDSDSGHVYTSQSESNQVPLTTSDMLDDLEKKVV